MVRRSVSVFLLVRESVNLSFYWPDPRLMIGMALGLGVFLLVRLSVHGRCGLGFRVYFRVKTRFHEGAGEIRGSV